MVYHLPRFLPRLEIVVKPNFFPLALQNVVFSLLLASVGCELLTRKDKTNVTILGFFELLLNIEAMVRCTDVAKPSPKRDRPQSKKLCRFITARGMASAQMKSYRDTRTPLLLGSLPAQWLLR